MANYTEYKMLSLDDAEKEIEKFDNMSDSEFNNQLQSWANYRVPEQENAFYEKIREGLVSAFKTAMAENNNKVGYKIDLAVGLKLYEILNSENGFNIIKANDDDFWRYISLRVIPDLTFIRYPNHIEDVEILSEYISNLSYEGGVTTEKGSSRLKKKRFYSQTRRIWIKTLWWYIFLGWQENLEDTYKVLCDNGSDIISHLIERTGKGYRVKLYRDMMYTLSLYPKSKDKTFRAAAKLNLAKCASLEPALTEGGTHEYSLQLFKEVYKKGA